MMAAKLAQPESITLAELLSGVADIGTDGDVCIRGMELDSRRVGPGDLFVALRGAHHDGSEFIEQALAAGAAAVLLDTDRAAMPVRRQGPGGAVVPVVPVQDLRRRLGVMAARFFREPARQLRLIGVTGTNGKTSVASFIAHCLQDNGGCGLIGTLGMGFPGALQPLVNTTPDAITINRALRDFCDQGAAAAVMEVSSHGLHQGRVSGLEFHVGVFTNLSHDHLDYHGDMETYGEAKKLLFTRHSLRHAVVNHDDEYGRRLCEQMELGVDLISYGSDLSAGEPVLQARNVEYDAGGVCFELHAPEGAATVRSGLLGAFSVSNLLAVAGVLRSLGIKLPEIARRLNALPAVPGRMERFGNRGISVVVDYAHTPDALDKVLRSLRAHCRGRLICVFGCGGDRDQVKRPAMGRIAADLADHVIVTDDNPRGESPAEIVRQIMGGITRRDNVEVLHDRAAAIRHAIAMAADGDMVLVAGKGHEDYQIIGTRRVHFSDREQVEALL